MEKKAAAKLDWSRLLGFDQATRVPDSQSRSREALQLSKLGPKVGIKQAPLSRLTKLGAKPGQKGTKPRS